MPSKYVPPATTSQVEPLAPVSEPTQDVGTGRRISALLTRIGAGVGSGIVGAVPTPVTTPLAAAIGGSGESLAEYLEGSPQSPQRIGVESALSAVPLGKVYQGGKLLANIARGAGLAEIGNLGRRKAATGSYLPQDKTEALWDVGSTVLGGAFGVIPGLQKGGASKPQDLLETLVSRATKDAPIGTRPSDVGDLSTGGRPVQVPADLPRVVKRGGLLIRPGEPEIPKVVEAKANVAAQTVPKEQPVSDLHTAGAQAREVSKANRQVNETARKAENSLLKKSEAADLADTKTRLGATNLGAIKAGEAKAQTKAVDAAAQQTKIDDALASGELEPSVGPVRQTTKGVSPEGEPMSQTTTFKRPEVEEGAPTLEPTAPAMDHYSRAAAIKTANELGGPTKFNVFKAEGIWKIRPRPVPMAEGVPPVSPEVPAAPARTIPGMNLFKEEAPVPVIQPSTPQVPVAGKAAKLAETEDASDELGKLMDAIHGEDAVPVGLNPQGHGTLPTDAPGPISTKAPTPSLPPGVAPIRMFRSPGEAAGENYGAIKAAKAAGEKVPEAGRAIAGKAAGAFNKVEQTKNMDAGIVANPKGKPAPGPAPKAPVDPLNVGPASDELVKLPPAEQETALKSILSQYKSEKGELDPVLLSRLGLGAAGAATGAVVNDEDPLTGALAGGAAGFYAPSVARALINHASTAKLNDSALGTIASKIEDTVKTGFQMLPDYQRFSLLSNPYNLTVNMWVGPYGAATMGSVEAALAGDQRGVQALKLLNPVSFGKGWGKSLGEAGRKLSDVEERTEGALGQAGPELFKTITKIPGQAMTAGDFSVRDILMKAGFSEGEARRMTLTSEPYMPWGHGISSFKKGAHTPGGKRSFIVNMMLPFYRTNVNQLEQGLERAPVIGMLAQRYWKDVPDPIKTQVVQQVIGGGVGGASFLLGTAIPEDQAKYVRKFIGDFGGQYGTIASAGFIGGQAYRAQSGVFNAVSNNLINRNLPLPSVQPLLDMADLVKAFNGDKDFKIPASLVPGIINPETPGSLGQLAGQLFKGATASDSSTAAPSTKSRYVPPAKRKPNP